MSGAQHHRWREDILAKPAPERLAYALDVIDWLVGESAQDYLLLRQKFGLTFSVARLVLMLSRAAPRVLTYETLFRGLYGDGSCELAGDKILHVYACKARKNGVPIRTSRGVGFYLDHPVLAPVVAAAPVAPVVFASVPGDRPKAGRTWLEQESADLLVMIESGSTLAAMADEFDRSERAIIEQAKKLGVRIGAARLGAA